ncbi:hypothetical protein GCM10025870_02340 [Agromyces marinus]|uniref:Uncharacterized protein n=1 Tax=Agromyces marinus TaxID=1389020 RepID=A0ABN6YAX7_9MICO|nr:hypothetical protein GCM10025870_02340 [Agromyces marinus]
MILHRVVCCYPNAESLLRASAAHARRSLVFSHPPNSWPARASTATVNLMMRLRRQEYRGFIHAPDRMYDVLRRSGLEMRSVERAGPWRVVAAVRGEDGGAPAHRAGAPYRSSEISGRSCLGSTRTPSRRG